MLSSRLMKVGKIFISLIFLAFWGCTTALAQMSGNMELRLTREGTQWKADAKIAATGQQLLSAVRDLRINGKQIGFTAEVLGGELRFTGGISGDSLSGTIEGFQGAAGIATGTWSLTRQKTDPAGDPVAGEWVGAFMLEGTGQPAVPPPASDLGFNASVSQPAYVKSHPKVFFDEAHNNADTTGGRYRPFSDMVSSDGYKVVPNRERFSKSAVKGYDVVVIVNASGTQQQRDASPFTEEECDAIRDWVSSGGALLVISDHAPFSAAISDLSKRFGVSITNGFTIDAVKYNKESEDQTELVFERQNGLLADHSITRGRSSTEQINRVITFSGTSLTGPPGSIAFLKLSDTAFDVLPPDRKQKSPEDAPPDARQVSAAGRAQGVAFEFGKGRVVVLAEAAMLTAQVTSRGLRFGMNVSGIDNRQLALNIMHWLSGLLK